MTPSPFQPLPPFPTRLLPIPPLLPLPYPPTPPLLSQPLPDPAPPSASPPPPCTSGGHPRPSNTSQIPRPAMGVAIMMQPQCAGLWICLKQSWPRYVLLMSAHLRCTEATKSRTCTNCACCWRGSALHRSLAAFLPPQQCCLLHADRCPRLADMSFTEQHRALRIQHQNCAAETM